MCHVPIRELSDQGCALALRDGDSTFIQAPVTVFLSTSALEATSQADAHFGVVLELGEERVAILAEEDVSADLKG